MTIPWYELGEVDGDWGGGLQSPDPRFQLDTVVAITTTTTGISTTGKHELVVAEEVGTVTRQGSGRILIRLDRRRTPVSIYLPTDLLEVLES